MTEDSSAVAHGEERGIRFLFLDLAPGITRLNAWVFFYAAFATIGLLTFVSTGTALVLNANFGMPIGDQGTVSGDLVIITEVVQLIIFGVVGVVSDRIGRREVAAAGMVLMGLGYLLYPFADTLFELFIYRAIYAAGLGAATGMLQTLIADYPSDSSRGKLVAVAGVCNGIGVLIVTVLFARSVPPMLVDAGFDAISSSRITHAIVGSVCVLSGVIYLLGLKKGLPTKKEERLPVRDLIVGGLAEARNPRIALSYACAFVARSDLVILGTFTVLWGTVAGVQQGMDPAVAAGRGAGMFGIASGASLLWLVVLGLVMDKFNRVTGVMFCMTFAAIGYCSMIFVDNPLDRASIPLFLLLGVGQISAFFGATTLISQEAPRLKRGTVMGMFNMSGAVGIFFAGLIGGRLFDAVGPYAPFVMIGVLNGLLVFFALIVRIKSPGLMPALKDAPAAD